MQAHGRAAVSVRYPVVAVPDSWELPEGTVPESIRHQNAAERLKQVLDTWARRTDRSVFVARNLAVRFTPEKPKTGIDPDVCVLEPPPDDPESLSSLSTWRAGHMPPPLSFEIVSANHPHKDYAEIQDRYAAMGTRELVVFDPLLVGPRALGGPVLLQLWRRDDVGILDRVYSGPGPVHSLVLDAWLHPRGAFLDIADDPEGKCLWPTGEEKERAEKEKERAEKEKERAEKEKERAEKEKERAQRIELERRLGELEARVSRGTG